MKKKYYILIFVLMLAACEKQSTWDLKTTSHDLVIVDGMIIDHLGIQSVRLSRPVDALNATAGLISGASVVITDEDSTYLLHESTSKPGIYNTVTPFIARLQKHYTLLISYNGKVYSAKTSMVPGSAFEPVPYVRDNASGLFQIKWTASPFSSKDPAMYEILLDWSKVAGYEASDSVNTHSRLLYYTLTTLDVSEIFAPQGETVRFPAGTIITENRYSLSPAHAAFIRALLLETTWQGGLFNTAQANVPTNLSQGAAGFFGACAITSLSMIATP